MSGEKPSGDNEAGQNRSRLREAFTLVVRIWRHSWTAHEGTQDWQAEISIVEPKSTSSSTRYAIGTKHIVNAVTESLEDRMDRESP
ncbi:hypothetical protein [Bradyrhizobium tropiciagri]|uniref:hypothetical protein n=1 Tax=Bradyrhizobium tropiciagri TaxID=312253 RepID=UPI001009F68D|nr:hypothetical protein [Bradyrhizobium tropiciagri]